MAKRNKTKRRNQRRTTQTRSKSGRFGSNRGETEVEVQSTAISARMVHCGIPYNVAKKQDSGSAVGRLYLNQEITQIQLDAANRWRQLSYNNKIAIGAKQQRSCCDVGPFGSSTETTDRQVERETRWMSEYKAARRAAFHATPLADMILQGIIDDDKDMPRFVGDLRLALNAIHNMFKVANVA